MNYSIQDIDGLNGRLIGANPEDVLSWALEAFPGRVALASSFGAEDVALIDLLARTGKPYRVFLLDTGRLHEETYDLVDRVRSRYGVKVEVYSPRTELVEGLTTANGFGSFRLSVENRKECCFLRKVEPLRRALSTVDAWITGLRRSQSVTRAEIQVVEIDQDHGGIAKINPLVNWSEEDVWSYIRANDVPYHPLHDQGYPSIGCAPCTRPIQPGDDVRAGRWWWESPEHKECGLHRH
jgi:phosphoadenosine phosphosulfate reductase